MAVHPLLDHFLCACRREQCRDNNIRIADDVRASPVLCMFRSSITHFTCWPRRASCLPSLSSNSDQSTTCLRMGKINTCDRHVKLPLSLPSLLLGLYARVSARILRLGIRPPRLITTRKHLPVLVVSSRTMSASIACESIAALERNPWQFVITTICVSIIPDETVRLAISPKLAQSPRSFTRGTLSSSPSKFGKTELIDLNPYQIDSRVCHIILIDHYLRHSMFAQQSPVGLHLMLLSC